MTEPEAVVPTSSRAGRVRWMIVVLLFFGVLINYIDRTNISVAGGPLGHEFGLTPGEMGWVFSSFLWSYTLMQIPAGLLLDRFGMKPVLRVATWIWAVACVLTAVASGTGLVILSRVLLGVAEAPVFPGAMKVTGYWFPRRERGLSTAVFDSGQRLSNVIGTPLVALAVVELGWRGAFWTTGALSVLFAVVFWVGYRNPKEAVRSGRLSEAEYRYIREGGAQDEDVAHPNPLANLGYVLGRRKVWGLSLGLACAGYTTWLLLTWLPGYLQSELHMGVLKSGLFTAIPWLIAVGAEFLIPGWLVDHLIKRGGRETVVRKSVLVAGMVIALGITGAAFTTDVTVALFWITVGTVGITLAYCVSNSLPALIAPEGSVGAVASVMNFINTLFGLAAPIVTGYLVQATGSFGPAFIVAGIIMAAGIFFYTVVLGPIEQIPSKALSS
ncbi:MFS transporter [Pseudonocardia spinosispora]|uniref:MFS transporter n=1 Tax=Pseudonocardia spinosispora TaxID=103441 RepID=UPI001FE1E9DD|nr:MFS transporter [Pseudonocardia spinosispora]